MPVLPRWTRYDFNGELFLPAADGDLAGGMVDLSDADRWRVITFDVDGGVGKLRGAARTLAADPSPQTDALPAAGVRPSLPPLRSAGMMLDPGGQGRTAGRAGAPKDWSRHAATTTRC